MKSKKHTEKAGNIKFRYEYDKCLFKTNYTFKWKNHLNSDKHNLTREEFKKMQMDKITHQFKIGNLTEIFVYKILQKNEELYYIEKIGYTGNNFDVIFKIKSETNLRGIQIKTLTQDNHRKNSYECNIHKNYEDDTLIIAINSENSVFSLFFKKDCGGGVCFTVGKAYKYNIHIYTDINEFTKKLFELIKQTTIIKNNDLTKYNTENCNKEVIMMDNLKNRCEKENLLFERNTVNDTPVDCFINENTIQCKSVTRKHGKKYHFKIVKGNGRGKKKSYEENDFDFLICQICGDKENFYIFPIAVLIEKGFIKTNEHLGKQSLCIAPHNYRKKDWTLEYLNKFDLLKN